MFSHPTIEKLAASISLAIGLAGLTCPAPALAQTRANVQASARVLEAGAAWTAHREALEAVRRVSGRASLTGDWSETVILTEAGVSEDAVPIPRIRVVAMSPMGVAESPAALAATGGRFSDVTGGVSGEDPAAGGDSEAVPATSGGVAHPAPTGRRLIVYVEHLCN